MSAQKQQALATFDDAAEPVSGVHATVRSASPSVTTGEDLCATLAQLCDDAGPPRPRVWSIAPVRRQRTDLVARGA
jgi:hypothetical protein